MNVRGACFSFALAASSTAHADKPVPVQTPVAATCEIVEVWATNGKGGMDGGLSKSLQKRLTTLGFKWTEFAQLSSTSKTLAKKKPEAVKLSKGSATITLVEIVDKASVRLTTDFNAAKGKATQTLTVAAGDWQMTVARQAASADADGHILAVGNCK